MFLCHLILPNLLFYVSARLVMFPKLEEAAFYRRRPMCTSSVLLSHHQSYYALGVPPMTAV